MTRRADRCERSQYRELVVEQDQVVSRSQLAELDWSHNNIRDEVAAGRWSSHGRRAVVLHTGPLTSTQRRWVAVINGGPTATLGGLTAAEEHGLTGFGTATIHLLVEQNAWVPAGREGVKIHVSRRFTLDDRHPARRIPTVRLERGLIDGAAWTPSPRRAAAILLAGVQQRLTTPTKLRETLKGTGRIRHGKLLRNIIDDAEGGVHALSELDFAHLCRAHELPLPIRQAKRTDAAGRTRYLDVRFQCRDNRVLNVEIDGAAHFEVVEAWHDMDRDIALLARGEPTIRLPSAVVRSDPVGIANRLRALLDAPW